SAVREAARALEYRFGEEWKGLSEAGILCGGLDRFYENTEDFWYEAEKYGCVLCENFARSMNQEQLTATVHMPAHAIPPWSGEVSALLEDLAPLTERKYS